MRLTCALMTSALLLVAPVVTYAAELGQTIPIPASPASAGQTVPIQGSQASADQIASVAGQVAQVATDPSIPVEVKTQQINSLAAQFNQLVLVWQQQTVAQAAGLTSQITPEPSALSSGATAQATPGALSSGATAVASASPASSPRAISTPATGLPTVVATPDSSRAGQLRSQIAAITQLMGTISQDRTLPADAKAAQLQDLAKQFDQLMLQLQQAS